jgi:hypothetical protein
LKIRQFFVKTLIKNQENQIVIFDTGEITTKYCLAV